MRFTKNIGYLIAIMLILGAFLLVSEVSFAAKCATGAECIAQAETGDGKGFFTLMKMVLNFLIAGVGIAVVIGIIVGGIQYTSSGGDAAKVTAAKSKITNALFALVAFIFLYAFLQWIIPGGAFS